MACRACGKSPEVGRCRYQWEGIGAFAAYLLLGWKPGCPWRWWMN